MGGIKKFSTFSYCQIEKKDRKSNGVKKRREQDTAKEEHYVKRGKTDKRSQKNR